ncbi:hypothetical protein HDU79_007426 [Rhizoclosmatium sp. JEL0117]|nr:hypothetical protein HDU79_007426 [Rhizoclosmatium sp. JEL0117]
MAALEMRHTSHPPPNKSLLRGTVNESLSTSHQPKPSTPLLHSHTPTTAIFAHHIPSRKPPAPPPRSTGSSSPTPSEMSDFSAPYDPHFLKLSPICPLALQSLPKPIPLPDPYESDDSDRPKKTRVKDRVLWVPVGVDDEKVVVKRDTEVDVLGDRALRLLRRKQAERNQESDSDGSDEESGSVSSPLPVVQLKRGRGRPRKMMMMNHRNGLENGVNRHQHLLQVLTNQNENADVRENTHSQLNKSQQRHQRLNPVPRLPQLRTCLLLLLKQILTVTHREDNVLLL